MTNLVKGFRNNSKLGREQFKKNIQHVIGQEARGFLIASFVGSLVGSFCSLTFCIALVIFFS
jgi:adenine/guanine phosphoribosyltransferase-like PRPP-binding protein